MQQRKITHADPQQIAQRAFEENLDANRVVIVGAEMPELKFSDIKFPQPEKIEVPVFIKQFETLEVPVVVKQIEYREIEKPIIVSQKELQIERVEIPVVIQKTEVQVIEKPVIIKETEYKDLPKGVMICLAVQSITSILLLLKMILK